MEYIGGLIFILLVSMLSLTNLLLLAMLIVGLIYIKSRYYVLLVISIGGLDVSMLLLERVCRNSGFLLRKIPWLDNIFYESLYIITFAVLMLVVIFTILYIYELIKWKKWRTSFASAFFYAWFFFMIQYIVNWHYLTYMP